MKVNRTLSAILNGAWAIEPKSAAGYLPLVASIIKGDVSAFDDEDADGYSRKDHDTAEAKAVVQGVSIFRKSSRWTSFNDAPKNSIAELTISGPIMKQGECGEPGTTLFSQWIKEADESPNISSILLKIDSPGGAVNGTATLGDAVKQAKKPVVAFIDDGMAASAAYWIASAADEIVLSQEHDQVGSIGVLVSIADWYGYFEEQGLKVRDIYASQSSEKNRIFQKAIEGSDDDIKSELLDPLADRFISTVTGNREGKLNLSKGDPFKGKLYMAKEAIEIGLADRVASYEEVIIGMGQKTKKDKNFNSDTMAKESWPQVASAIGVEALESSEEGVYLTVDQMNALNEELDREVVDASDHQQTSDDLEALQGDQATALQAVNDQLEAAGEEPAESIAEGSERLGSLVQEYGKASGADFTKAKVEKSAEEEEKNTTAQAINDEIDRKAGVA